MPSQRSAGVRRFVIHAILTIAIAFVIVGIASLFAPWEFTGGNVVLRAQRGMSHEFAAPEGGQLVVPSHNRRNLVVAEESRPRNVILMIGDGMGVGQASAASALTVAFS